MSDLPPNPEPFAVAESRYKECQLVSDFVAERVVARVERLPRATTEAQSFDGALRRVLGWMRSLSKLSHPGDFQAVVAGSRALFEIAIDVTIMHFDRAANPVEKLLAWEDSAKLKSAVKIQKFLAEKGRSPRDYGIQLGFVETQTARIEALRVKHWPDKKGKGRQPERWTGRTLPEDAEAATMLFSKGEFDEFYAARYPQLCWNVHGSGLAGVRYVSERDFPGISALAFGECAHFALVASEVVLRHFNLWDAAVEADFKEHHVTAVQTRYETLLQNRSR